MSDHKRFIVAARVDHADIEVYRQAMFKDTAQLAADLAQPEVYTKADFLALDSKHKSFIDSPAGWNNFDEIVAFIRDSSGEQFTFEDFTNPMVPGGDKKLIDSARANGGLAKVFSFELWKGRYTEFEKLTYQLTPVERVKFVPIELKRNLLQFEGKILPEDRLAAANLNPARIKASVISNYNFEKLLEELAAAGDYFRKDYVLMRDADGDTLFADRMEAWTRFEQILEIMKKHGERLEVSDYLRQMSNKPSMLGRAAEKGALQKVFAPAQWVDRLSDMMSLWLNLPKGQKSDVIIQFFDNAYATAESMTYIKRLSSDQPFAKADLLKPVNDNVAGEKPVLPLGLKAIWNRIAAVKATLADNGEKLTLKDLEQKSGLLGDSCLISAAKFGSFDRVVEIARESGEQLTLEHYLSTDGHGNKLIDILAEKKQLKQVFTEVAWTGRIAEMEKLWSQVTPANQKQIDDYPKLKRRINQETMKKPPTTVRKRPVPGAQA